MKILLIQPPSVPEWSRHVFAYEPLALEYIGAGLKQDGHTVRLLDARFDPGIEAMFEQMQPDVVGLTAYTVHVPWVRNLAERLKVIDPDVFIVVGGHHATVRPADFNSSSIDARRMDRLADLIQQAGLRKKYFLYGRVDTIVKHPDLFAKWRDAGLAQVFVGLESFSDRRLNRMNRRILRTGDLALPGRMTA
jgi:radical SAM superfamily enzyme YgiQ (UPF0313 family)